MTKRAQQLHAAADVQITTMIELLTRAGQPSLSRPCSGREKLGDGTVGVLAAHTTDTYQRIATFAATSHRVTAGHQPAENSQHRPSSEDHAQGYTAESANPTDLVARLSTAREYLDQIAVLTDRQLDAIPPKDSFRFCDGQRTLEQVLSGLLKHQARQLEVLIAAIE